MDLRDKNLKPKKQNPKTKPQDLVKDLYYKLLHTVFEEDSAKQIDADMEKEELSYIERLDIISIYPEAAIYVGRKRGTWG